MYEKCTCARRHTSSCAQTYLKEEGAGETFASHNAKLMITLGAKYRSFVHTVAIYEVCWLNASNMRFVSLWFCWRPRLRRLRINYAYARRVCMCLSLEMLSTRREPYKYETRDATDGTARARWRHVPNAYMV